MGGVDATIVIYRQPANATAGLLDVLGRSPIRRVRILLSACSAETVTAVEVMCTMASLGSPEIRVRPDNLGFAGGHNLLMTRAFADEADACLLLNPDLSVGAADIVQFLRSVEAHAGPRTLHAPQLVLGELGPHDKPLVDSNGIRWTSTRRHFDEGQGAPANLVDAPVSVAGLSGACLLVRRDVHDWVTDRSGFFFDPLFVAYREDAELSLRVREFGGECLIHPSSGFVHARGSANGVRNGYHQRRLGVRNRFLLSARIRGAWRHFPLSPLRDALVLVASLFRAAERQGLRESLALQPVMRARRRRVERHRLRSVREAIRPVPLARKTAHARHDKLE